MSRTEVDSPCKGLAILVVDDEANIRKTLAMCLESLGHRVVSVGNPQDAVAEVARHAFDLVFVDVRLGTSSGLDLIPPFRESAPWMKIVVITAYASIDTAVEAMRRGAADYIPKPFTPEQIQLMTERVSHIRNMERHLDQLRDDINQLHPEINFQTSHAGVQRALELARRAAASEAIMLLRGPSGTGKTVLARAIHQWSGRAERPFGVVSCPALSADLLESELFGHVKGAFTGALRDQEGRIAACDGGTLFLDEIGDLPLAIQPKLLRFIQEREYERVGDPRTRRADVRILAATNTNLEDAIREGKFREDLYYRLNVIAIELPPLAERPDDVAALAASMLAYFAAQNHKPLLGFTGEALDAMRGYAWPGNVRELRNVVERAAILCADPVVPLDCLPESIRPRQAAVALGDRVPLHAVEELHIRRVLARTSSLQDAAEILGIDQATLWRKRKQYGI